MTCGRLCQVTGRGGSRQKTGRSQPADCAASAAALHQLTREQQAVRGSLLQVSPSVRQGLVSVTAYRLVGGSELRQGLTKC